MNTQKKDLYLGKPHLQDTFTGGNSWYFTIEGLYFGAEAHCIGKVGSEVVYEMHHITDRKNPYQEEYVSEYEDWGHKLQTIGTRIVEYERNVTFNIYFPLRDHAYRIDFSFWVTKGQEATSAVTFSTTVIPPEPQKIYIPNLPARPTGWIFKENHEGYYCYFRDGWEGCIVQGPYDGNVAAYSNKNEYYFPRSGSRYCIFSPHFSEKMEPAEKLDHVIAFLYSQKIII